VAIIPHMVEQVESDVTALMALVLSDRRILFYCRTGLQTRPDVNLADQDGSGDPSYINS